MDGAKKKTGLGVDALFQSVNPKPETSHESTSQAVGHRTSSSTPVHSEPPPRTLKPRSEKMRTTVMLSPDTLAGMDLYKMRLKRLRKKPSYSEIIDEAIRIFLKIHEVDVQP